MVAPLYLDSSAFLKLILDESESASVERSVNLAIDEGRPVVSSRLLSLEAHRVAVRAELPLADMRAQLSMVNLVAVDEAIWESAERIGVHVKSLDAIHLATCARVGAALLTFDATMRSVGSSWFGIEMHNARPA